MFDLGRWLSTFHWISKIIFLFVKKIVCIPILTWFFVLKLLEQSSAHKSHVILSNLQCSEPSFEQQSLGMSCFSKTVEIRNLFLFILTFEAAFWRFWTYITRISQTVSKKARQFGSCCHASGNSGVVNKSPVIVLTKVNIKIKMDHAKFLLKSSCTKWISFKSWF